MMQAFTRNYEDNSTEAGFQFTFYCDNCSDGYKTSFMESTTYKRGAAGRLFGQGAAIAGSLLGGRAYSVGWAAEHGSNVLSQRFDGRSPDWQKEHEQAFAYAQNEAKSHFHRCPGCSKYACDACWNENQGLCISCAPRQEVYVAQARAEAMQRNIDEAGHSATVWQGAIESKTTICPVCGKPAGSGKFCNNCGTSMELKVCVRCGAQNSLAVNFCNNCGQDMSAAPAPTGVCRGCGVQNPPGTRFCGSCGQPQ